MSGVAVAMAVVAVILNIVIFIVFISFLGPWMQCKAAGVRVGFVNLISMKMRKVNIKLITENAIKAHVKQVDVSHRDLEEHFLA